MRRCCVKEPQAQGRVATLGCDWKFSFEAVAIESPNLQEGGPQFQHREGRPNSSPDTVSPLASRLSPLASRLCPHSSLLCLSSLPVSLSASQSSCSLGCFFWVVNTLLHRRPRAVHLEASNFLCRALRLRRVHRGGTLLIHRRPFV